MSGKSPADRSGRGAWASEALAVVVLALMVAVYLRLLISFLPADPANYPDEAAHYVTGVMVFDYLKEGFPGDPIAFAREFYLHYPKVALGHWPPAFYAVEAAWFAITGPTVAGARALCVATALSIAALLWYVLWKARGRLEAHAAAAVFLGAPVVLRSAPSIMSDCMVALFLLAALLFLEHALRAGGNLSWVAFIAASTLAILTKGSGWALGPAALLMPVLVGRTAHRGSPFAQRWYWVAGALVVLCAAPFYLWVQQHGIGYPIAPAVRTPGDAAIAHVWLEEWHRRYLVLRPLMLGRIAPWHILLLAIVGAAGYFRLRTHAAFGVAAAIAGIFGQVVFQLVLPSTVEERYYIPSLACCVILAMAALARVPARYRHIAIPVVMIASGWQLLVTAPPVPITGYAAVASRIPPGTAVLVAADANAEGALIARAAERDQQPEPFLLRGTKMLADSDRNGAGYRLRHTTADEINAVLLQVPVRRVVMGVEAPGEWPHLALLRKDLRTSAVFRLEGEHRITAGEASEAVRVYGITSGQERPPDRELLRRVSRQWLGPHAP